MYKSYLIASNRPWTRGMAERLSKSLSAVFDEVSTQEEFLDRISKTKYSSIFIPFWSYIIPSSILSENECIIFHMTDLPFGRGGSPLQNLISRGIYSTKICAVKAVEELDAGDVYLRRDLALEGRAETIYINAAKIIEGMIEEIVSNNPKPVPQKGDPVVFKRRKAEDGDISSLTSLTEVYDYIRMLDAEGYPAAFLETKEFKLEFNNAVKSEKHLEAKVTIRLKGEKR